MQNKGDISMVNILFLIGIVSLIGAVFVYSKSEDTAYHKILERYNHLVGEYNGTKSANEALIKANETLTKEVIGLKDQITTQAKQLDEVVKDCQAAQDHCARLRSSMIQLQDKVSRRRPVMKLEGPIQLEIISTKTNPRSPHLKQLEKEQLEEQKTDPKLMKKIKKQMDELSK